MRMLMVVLAAALLAACTARPPVATPHPRAPVTILIGIDGFRAVVDIFISPILLSYKWQDVAVKAAPSIQWPRTMPIRVSGIGVRITSGRRKLRNWATTRT